MNGVTGQATSKPLTYKQREAIKTAYVTGGEAPDLYDFATSRTLAFHNRERVLDALKRRGLLNDDGTLTDAGVALAERLMGITGEPS